MAGPLVKDSRRGPLVIFIAAVTSYLKYEPLSGKFFWIRPPSFNKDRMVGKVAGSRNNRGYWRIGVSGKSYQAHRLAWYFSYREWPKGMIDHINGNKCDNRLVNLRIVSALGNSHNSYKHRCGRLIGCHFVKSLKRWRSIICIDGKRICLGHFFTEKEAHDRYMKEVVSKRLL